MFACSVSPGVSYTHTALGCFHGCRWDTAPAEGDRKPLLQQQLLADGADVLRADLLLLRAPVAFRVHTRVVGWFGGRWQVAHPLKQVLDLSFHQAQLQSV